MNDDFRAARDAAAANARRWSEELETAHGRATLFSGMIQQASGYAEDLLRRAVRIFMARNPEMAAQAMTDAAGGKKTAERLTLGQCIKVLGFMDARRGLFTGAKLISRSDQAILDKVSRLRNDFAHGRAHASDVAKTKELLSGVRRLCDMNVIATAMRMVSE